MSCRADMGCDNIIIRPAAKNDYREVAQIISMAFGEDMMRRLFGDNGIGLLEDIVLSENSQYSYRNAIVCEVDGRVAGALCGYDGDRLEELRRPVIDLIVARRGCVPTLERETTGGEFYLDSIGVMPSMRGMGIGVKLLENMCETVFAAGFERVGLLVDAENQSAERLYTRLGFGRCGEVMFLGHKMYHLQLVKR